MNNDFFTFDEFKRWMKKQDNSPGLNKPSSNNKFIGLEVCSRVSARKLEQKIEVLEGIAEEIIHDFKNSGGLIKDVADDFNFVIEVDSGTFSIHRCYTTKV
jgi:hypothetical protein